jgi:DNA-binding NtrC family response regulator
VDAASGHAPPGEDVSREEFDRLLAIKKEVDPGGEYVGESLAILRVFEDVVRLNKTPHKPVLILGPTGAGKTEIAGLIHKHSARRDRRFVEVQASDFMGADFRITKGHWTGIGKKSGLPDVKEGSPGLLAEAEGGTIFIDELAEVPLDFQTFLLRILDRKETPLAAGVGKPVKPNVRLIFATNMTMDEAVRAHKLRHDLLSRLEKGTLPIPSLSERKEDIFLFVHRYCGKHSPSPEFLLYLLKHSWPGNVRELLADLERAKGKATQPDERLTLDHLRQPDELVVQEVRRLHPGEVEKQVYRALAAMLQRQGLRKGAGLYKRMADFLDVSEATVSRQAGNYLPDLPSRPQPTTSTDE